MERQYLGPRKLLWAEILKRSKGTTFTQAIRTGFVGARKLNQIMPWHTYRGMTDEDTVAMFAYLKTLKPVRHHVDNTEPPTFCNVCRQTHGGGNQD